MNSLRNKIYFLCALFLSISIITGFILFAVDDEKKTDAKTAVSNGAVALGVSEISDLLKLQKEIETGRLQVELFKKLVEKVEDKKKKETLTEAFLKSPKEFAEQFMYWVAHNWITIFLVVGSGYMLEKNFKILSMIQSATKSIDKNLMPTFYDKDGNKYQNCERSSDDNFQCDMYIPQNSTSVGVDCSGVTNNGGYEMHKCIEDRYLGDNITSRVDLGLHADKYTHVCNWKETPWGLWFTGLLSGGKAVCPE